MSLLSILIPARNERFLVNTVNDLLQHATGEIEVIVTLDGYWPDPPLPDDKRVRIIHFGAARGMRAGINAAAGVARGKYLMKCDAHTSWQEGFDEVLTSEIEDNWIVIPRRDRLDAEIWGKHPDEKRPPIDYHYLSCPITNKDGYSMHGAMDNTRARERSASEYDIDETMSFQGSAWVMSRKHWDWLGGMPEEFYGSFSQEPQQIGMKTWLGGGKIMVNKKTTYGHLFKGKKYGRMYSVNSAEIKKGHYASARYWMSDTWEKRIHNMAWLIDRFSPCPTWPENWQAHRFENIVNGTHLEYA